MTWYDLAYYLALILAACAFLGLLAGIAMWDELRERDDE